MRIWDIVDQVDPGVRITETAAPRRHSTRFVSSAVQVAFAVGVIVATSGSFIASRQHHASEISPKVRIITSLEPGAEAATPMRAQRVSAVADTQFGQSTSKLSSAFSAYFQQAPDEETYEDDYSFS